MAKTINRRLAELIDSSGQLTAGKLPDAFITTAHYSANSITDAKLHTSFSLPASALTARDTGDLSEGSNLYYTDARADARIAAADTGDLSEGSNLYYTDARVGTYISGNRTFGNITTTGYIAGPASMVIDPAGVGDNTGTVVIAGNLQVDGTTTTINSTTVSIDDLNFTIASDAADSSAANGAGITIGGASATMLYTHATTSFDFNKPVNVTGAINSTGTGRAIQVNGTTRINSVGDIIATSYYVGGNAIVDTNRNLLNIGTISSGAVTATGLTINTDADSSLSIADGGTDAIVIKAAAGDELYVGANNAYKLRFKTDGDIVMDNGGAFGIGTASPSTPLHVKETGSTSAVQEFLRLENHALGGAGAGSSINFHHYHAGGGPTGGAKAASITAQNMATWPAGTPSSYSTGLTFSTLNGNTFAERMRITSDGDVEVRSGAALKVYRDTNAASAQLFMDAGEKLYIRNSYANKDLVFDRDGKLGIGTSSPAALLSIAGSLGVGETGSTGNRLQITTSSTGAIIKQADNSPIIFQTATGTAEKMRILDNGKVTIGSAGDGISGTHTKLEVHGAIAAGSAQGTGGSLVLYQRYGENDMPATLSTHYSNSYWLLATGMKARSGASGYVSSLGNYSTAKAGIEINNSSINYLYVPAATHAVDTVLTPRSPFHMNLDTGTLEFRTTANTLRGYISAQETNTGGTHHAGLILATSGGESITFKDSGIGGDTNMVITGGGNVGIGITPTGYATNGYNLRLHGGVQTYLSFNNTTHTTQVLGGFVIGNDASAARITQRENQPMIFATNDTTRMEITADGVVSAPIASTHGGQLHGAQTPNPAASYLGSNGAGFGTTAIYRTPVITSSSTTAATSQFLTIYTSGHWGEYPVFKFRVYGTYYVAGYREYVGYMTAGSASLVEVELNGTTSFIGGGGNNTITMGPLVSSGLASHGGQPRYRRDFTLTNHGIYGRCYVVVEIMYGGNRYYGSSTSTATLDALGSSGGSYHFKTMSTAQGQGTFST